MTGSITQSQLKAKLQARKAAETDPEKAAKINVDRELQTSDLSISDCTVSIEIVLPKFWDEALKKRAQLKRVKTTTTEIIESTEEEGTESTGSGTTEGGSTNNGSGSGSTENGGGSDNGGNSGGGYNTGD